MYHEQLGPIKKIFTGIKMFNAGVLFQKTRVRIKHYTPKYFFLGDITVGLSFRAWIVLKVLSIGFFECRASFQGFYNHG